MKFKLLSFLSILLVSATVVAFASYNGQTSLFKHSSIQSIAIDLAAGSPGLGSTPTGLAFTGERWIIANDGRIGEKDPFNASVSIFSSDFSRLERTINLSALNSELGSVQGIAFDRNSNTLYFVSPQVRAVFSLSLEDTPVVKRIFDLTFPPNALGLDPSKNQIVVGRSFREPKNVDKILTWFSKDGQEMNSIELSANPDHIAFDSMGRLMFSYGENKIDGYVSIIDPTTHEVIHEGQMAQADAIEGIAEANGKLYIVNDARFHNGTLDHIEVFDLEENLG